MEASRSFSRFLHKKAKMVKPPAIIQKVSVLFYYLNLQKNIHLVTVPLSHYGSESSFLLAFVQRGANKKLPMNSCCQNRKISCRDTSCGLWYKTYTYTGFISKIAGIRVVLCNYLIIFFVYRSTVRPSRCMCMEIIQRSFSY
jgi:hypothetical protein